MFCPSLYGELRAGVCRGACAVRHRTHYAACMEDDWEFDAYGGAKQLVGLTTGGPAIKYCWLLYRVLLASLPSTAGFSIKYSRLLYQVLPASHISTAGFSYKYCRDRLKAAIA